MLCPIDIAHYVGGTINDKGIYYHTVIQLKVIVD